LIDFFTSGNFAYINSEVDLSGDIGVATESKRPLQGQSPFVLNLSFGYDNPEKQTSIAVLYNIFGERIDEVGSFGLPDVYEQPFHQLDFVFARYLGKGFSFKFKAHNLLDDDHEFTQGNEIKTVYKKGREFSISMTFRP